jgi:hypothetical protein
MFGQFLPNKNKMLQYNTLYCSVSAGPKSGQLNKPNEQVSPHPQQMASTIKYITKIQRFARDTWLQILS